MQFAKPKFPKAKVNRAGEILRLDNPDPETEKWAYQVLANWRACHAYPINTFQATLRKKLKNIDGEAIVAQRLKRAPSVVAKLKRFKTMNLVQMQDIGGLRAIVDSTKQVRDLEANYRNSKFDHELMSSKDYIKEPKKDGYRSVHLIYKYSNLKAPKYKGLLIELQLRTRYQHAWATAVETMGTFLGQALKSGQGNRKWRGFFEISSAALAQLERTESVPGYGKYSLEEISRILASEEKKLNVLTQLRGFSIAADKINKIKGAGSYYHLVILDSALKSVSIRPFTKNQLDNAAIAYSEVERRTQQGEKVEAVLVSAGPIDALKKAYPNFFLDTHFFVEVIGRIIKE